MLFNKKVSNAEVRSSDTVVNPSQNQSHSFTLEWNYFTGIEKVLPG